MRPVTGGPSGLPDHPASETRISAAAGDSFSITAKELPGEDWYLVAPKPDRSVVRFSGDDHPRDAHTEGEVGASRRHVFTFRAMSAGRARIVLLHCPVTACPGGTGTPPSALPSTTAPSRATPARLTYTVTVH